MSATWYSLTFSAIPPNNYSVSYYFSVASGFVTGIYRYDDLTNTNILAPQTIFGNNSGSDNIFTVATLSFSNSNGTNFYDPSLCSNIISGFSTATNYFNLFSNTGVNAKAGIYYWNNTGTNGGYLIARSTVTAYASPNIVSIGSQPNQSVSPLGNSISQYYFNDLSYNYKTGTYDLSLVNVGTVTSPITRVSSTINGSSTFSLYQPVMNDTGYSYYTSNSTNSLTNSVFSISFWFNVVDTNAIGSLVSLCDSNNNLITLSTNVERLFVGIRTNNNTNYTSIMTTSANIFTAGYNHIALVCSTAASKQVIQIYVNNVLVTGYNNATLPNATITYTNSSSIVNSNIIFNGTSPILYVLGGPSASAITWPANGSGILSRPARAYISQLTVYNIALTASNVNYLYTNIVVSPVFLNQPYPCFLQGSKILCLDPISDTESYIAVEKLRRGDLIKTSMDGYKAISFIGRATLANPANDPDPKNRLYVFKKQTIKGMTEDLCITGEHCTLRLDVTESHLDRIREHMGRVYITDDQFRCPACLDERATPYERGGPATIWHFALEHDDAYWNYGVWANGLLVESCSIEHLVKRSKMMLI